MRHLIITLLAAFISMAAVAQSSGCIYIEDFEIAPDSTLTVPVMLTNAEATQGFQFQMLLPQGLVVEDMELTKYSRRMKMSLAKNEKNGKWIVAVYSLEQTSFPPDTAKVILMTLTALPEFEGGDITISKSQGSSLEYTSINYDDSSATVTRASMQ